MEFRPCIDIHNGKVKQIVGSSLKDENNRASENFSSDRPGSYFSEIYKNAGLRGGHIILLNSKNSEYYEATKAQAIDALSAYKNGMQLGGGINPENAEQYLDAGASHVIVTSYVFSEGRINMHNLDKMVSTVGKEHLVLDLSCRKTNDGYVVVTDRWQTITDQVVDAKLLSELSGSCDEFLIHAVDVEGKNSGIEVDLVRMLAEYRDRPITYAGGVHSFEDIDILNREGKGSINMTIGSALDLFGGKMEFTKIVDYVRNIEKY